MTPIFAGKMPGPSLDESLRRSPRLSRTDLQYLQEWLSLQPHLPPMRDEELVPFLHTCEYSLERTKEFLDTFFTMRTHAPDIFSDRDPTLEANRSQIDFFHVVPLPKKDSRGFHVLGMGFEPVDLAKFNANRSAKMCSALMEAMLIEEPTGPGYVVVMDARNLALGHLARASLHLLHALISVVQLAVPTKLQIVHVIHVTSVVEKAMALVKPFMGRDLQKRIFFHSGSMDGFYEALPRDILPKEYGGTCGSTASYHKDLVEKMLSNREWILSLDRRLVDEHKRPGRARSVGDVYGIEGSFKQLQID